MKALVILGLLLFLVSAANADCLRCGSRNACTGDSKIEVISKCGQPDDSETTSYDSSGSVSGSGRVDLHTTKVDTFYYNCGEGRFIHTLTFHGSKLISIKRGGYGSGPAKCE